MSSQGDVFRHEGTRGAGVCSSPRKLSCPPPQSGTDTPPAVPHGLYHPSPRCKDRPLTPPQLGGFHVVSGLLRSVWGGRVGEGQAVALSHLVSRPCASHRCRWAGSLLLGNWRSAGQFQVRSLCCSFGELMPARGPEMGCWWGYGAEPSMEAESSPTGGTAQRSTEFTRR